MKNIKLIIFIVAFGATISAFLFYWHSRVDELEALIPKGRCVKSQYDDDGRVDRVYINCQSDDGKNYTIIARSLKDEVQINNIYLNLKEGKEIKDFICSEFKNPDGASSPNKITSLHTCFSKKRFMVVTATSEEAIVFFINQY
ncbi:hypothetical protein [Paracidovorax cattleyae]|uniref:hypothetical protein n=1 Tax=Paracidovorax cattleyae TaxID=80868 RepID=UPI0018AFBB32|nr:hypothetical protein [Paracidovorax cattleyae]MBF9264121.1 hypothetical protein [Paracidovorax cattleyae]